MGTEIIWFKTGTRGRLLETWEWTFGFCKRLGIYRQAELLSASEGLSFFYAYYFHWSRSPTVTRCFYCDWVQWHLYPLPSSSASTWCLGRLISTSCFHDWSPDNTSLYGLRGLQTAALLAVVCFCMVVLPWFSAWTPNFISRGKVSREGYIRPCQLNLHARSESH
jgi:hypothetical protein